MRCAQVALAVVTLLVGGALPAADRAAEKEAARYVATLRGETKDPGKLAEKIFEAAGAVEGNPAFQVALYEKAYEEDMRASAGCPTAIRAARKLLEVAPEQKMRWRGDLVKAYEKQLAVAGPGRTDAGRNLLALYLDLCEEYIAAGELDQALGVLKQRDRVGRIVGPYRMSEIAAKRTFITNLKKIQAQLRMHQSRLKSAPDDRRCRLDLLRLYVVELDDPAGGLELLTADVDETWRTYVPLAAQAPADLKEAACLELGHWYWQHAEGASVVGASRMQKRAGTYYRRFLRLHAPKDADYLTAKMRLDRIDEAARKATRITFGAVKGEVTTVVQLGPNACKVWQILPGYATGTRYRVSIKHAAAGLNGAFHIVAFADESGDGTPDLLIGMSPLQKTTKGGQWSSWTFETKHKAVFVGNAWKSPLKDYYADETFAAGYVGLSSTMYLSRERGKIPKELVGSRYTNILVEVIE